MGSINLNYRMLLRVSIWFLSVFLSCNSERGEHQHQEHHQSKVDELVRQTALDNQSDTTVNTLIKKEKPTYPIILNDLLGINAFEWDFLQDPNRPSEPGLNIYEPKMRLIKSFSGVRHYLDWEKLEDHPGSYTFNPTRRGGWNYDTIYRRCKEEGIFVVTCIQTTPDWLYNTYPEKERSHDNIPAPYGADRENPASYLAQAKAAFQFAARYGSNGKVDRSLVHVNDTARWNTDRINEVKIGLDLVHYVECGNEPDKWWKGNGVQQNGRQYAANLSAFYDGHKGTLGKDVGVKSADPTMKVVMGGLARANVAFIKDMIAWCKEHRGYKKDGHVDLCFDILNYHLYSNDNLSWFSKLFKSASHGIAPELSNLGEVADSFVHLSNELGGMPVWSTEVGYDLDSKSLQRAIPIGSKSAEMVQADWLIRTALLYGRHGVDKVFFYQLYDNDASNIPSGMAFGKSGLLAPGKRRVAADYFVQLRKLMGNYQYVHTVEDDPIVDVYQNDHKKMYVLVVPDQQDRKENYTLNVKEAKQVKIHYLRPKADVMETETRAIQNGRIKLLVTETPIFVEAAG
ncbi:hypothetical protein GCM10023231_03270 [Olivibacter ginsenosidimutans]|uniref:Glycoside hydrolase family 42 N-terminal domain-containing protein n=1 Tax=Olivibacter ginsenosidimutans TaxID=1176537 RepID=A0ABP9AEJ4_9SPHI